MEFLFQQDIYLIQENLAEEEEEEREKYCSKTVWQQALCLKQITQSQFNFKGVKTDRYEWKSGKRKQDHESKEGR